MKKIINSITLTIILSLFLITPKTASAQAGSFTCYFTDDDFDPGAGTCELSTENCNLGYEPNENYCPQFDDNKTLCKAALGVCTYIGPGSFKCNDPTPGSCWAASGGDYCNDGFERYQEYCEQCGKDETDACNNAPGANCIPIDSSPPDPLPTIPGCTEGKTATPIEPFQPDLCECDPEDDTCQRYRPIRTAIGCISTHPLAALDRFKTIIISISGGIVLLMLVIGSFFILTSQGNPEQIKRGKEVFTGAIIGLVFIIFSVFIMELIGTDLLGIFN